MHKYNKSNVAFTYLFSCFQRKDSTQDKMAGLTRGSVLGWLVQGFAWMGKRKHTDLSGAGKKVLGTNLWESPAGMQQNKL